MNIERLNDNQVKCTLSREDLAERDLRITELAYGTEKAKGLFRDMVQKASYELGFDSQDVPLMIEAIPTYPDSLVLLISKAPEAYETDSRFASFTEDSEDSEEFDIIDEDDFYNSSYDEDDFSSVSSYTNFGDDDYKNNLSDDPLSIDLNQNSISAAKLLGNQSSSLNPDLPSVRDIISVFEFEKLDDISNLAENLVYVYTGKNSLYKDVDFKKYFLVVHKSEHTLSEYNKICNLISEYGKHINGTYATDEYYEEHFEPLISDHALQVLGSL